MAQMILEYRSNLNTGMSSYLLRVGNTVYREADTDRFISTGRTPPNADPGSVWARYFPVYTGVNIQKSVKAFVKDFPSLSAAAKGVMSLDDSLQRLLSVNARQWTEYQRTEKDRAKLRSDIKILEEKLSRIDMSKPDDATTVMTKFFRSKGFN